MTGAGGAASGEQRDREGGEKPESCAEAKAAYSLCAVAGRGYLDAMKVALISGTSIVHSSLFTGWEEETVETKYGAVRLKIRGEMVVLNRHGFGAAPLPPHRINFHANIAALAALGVRDVVAFNSVGSLKPELAPGAFVSCSDYVDFQAGPVTYFDDEIKGGAPGIDNRLARKIAAALAPEFQVVGELVYVQTRGPRFETKAEIRVLRQWGDVVGMTMAHEADLCTELGLRYNSLGMVDNYANGIEDTAIDHMKFKALVQENQARVNRFMERLLEVLA